MSLTGRYVIDRIKRAVGHRIRLPVPPYGDPNYWDGAYQSFGPDDTYEWGDVNLSDLLEYQYKPVAWDTTTSSSHQGRSSSRPSRAVKKDDEEEASSSSASLKTTSLAETLGISPHASKDESILMLGCGNSKLGEEMINHGWRGPIVQVDVSSRIVEAMSIRCADLVTKGDMNFVMDDATELSAFRNDVVSACIDKGLVDALFCADDYDQCRSVLSSVHRVLQPGGIFVFLSFSRPEFVIPNVILTKSSGSRIGYEPRQRSRKSGPLWENIQVQESNRIMLYRFQKAEKGKGGEEEESNTMSLSVRKGSRKRGGKLKSRSSKTYSKT